jgi:sugar lactone lactonase YvrE
MEARVLSDVAVFREARSILAESLCWDDDLRWCDIGAGLVYRSPVDGHVDGRDDEVLRIPAPVTALQPLAAGAEFVFSGADYVAIAGNDGTVRSILARVRHASERVRFNEGKCDPAGRFVVGSMNLDNEADAALYSVDETGAVRTLLGGIGVANGFEWSQDGSVMWFTDTATATIYRGDYSAAGELSHVEPFVRGRMSDGLARDVDGGFWNGVYDTGTVVHWSPDGVLDLEVDVPAVHVTSVGFGGGDLSTLFVATARENCTEEQLEDQPLTGSIFRVETSTHGYPTRTFGTSKKGSRKWNWESPVKQHS